MKLYLWKSTHGCVVYRDLGEKAILEFNSHDTIPVGFISHGTRRWNLWDEISVEQLNQLKAEKV
jgi:hypothetical protein